MSDSMKFKLISGTDKMFAIEKIEEGLFGVMFIDGDNKRFMFSTTNWNDCVNYFENAVNVANLMADNY